MMIHRFRRLTSSHLFALALLLGWKQTGSSDTKSKATLPRRERQLDHLDLDTLAFYTGIDPSTFEATDSEESYVGYDVAVMFYAQWDQNSHTLAPYWDNFASRLKAGSKSSKLIMGLFNCELDLSNLKMCTALGVEGYPTFMYIGAGTYHDMNPVTSVVVGKEKSAGPMGASKLARTVKFQGNWQYTESVMDWIKAMRALSSWHQNGWLKQLRQGLSFWSNGKGGSSSLPVGLPSGKKGNGMVSNAKLDALETKMGKAEKDLEEISKSVSYTNKMIDAMFFPVKNGTDAYEYLKGRNGWDVTKETDVVTQVIRSCVMELSLDYCTRFSVNLATEFVESNSESTDFPSLLEVEMILSKQINETEPFCGFIDACVPSEFKQEECRPGKCPFKNAVACSYLTSCYEESLQKEYAIALKLIKEGDSFPPKPTTATKPQDSTPKKKTGGWGFV